nr:hypothetical protein Cduv_444 [Cedratvirus duvanny]
MNETKVKRMAKIAECVASSGMMDSYCNLRSDFWNEKLCRNSLINTERCIKKIYRKVYKEKLAYEWREDLI